MALAARKRQWGIFNKLLTFCDQLFIKGEITNFNIC